MIYKFIKRRRRLGEMEHTIFATNEERPWEIWGKGRKMGQEAENELLEWKRKKLDPSSLGHKRWNFEGG